MTGDTRIPPSGPDRSIAMCAQALFGEPAIACPDQLLPLANAIAEIDAHNIVRTIWPHLLEAGLAGLEPFTLGEAS